MEPKRIYIVGKYKSGDKIHEIAWSVEGTFIDEQKAIDACINGSHFVMEVLFNDIDYNDKVGRTWYPNRESKEEGLSRVAEYQKSFNKE